MERRNEKGGRMRKREAQMDRRNEKGGRMRRRGAQDEGEMRRKGE